MQKTNIWILPPPRLIIMSTTSKAIQNQEFLKFGIQWLKIWNPNSGIQNIKVWEIQYLNI